MNAQQAIFDELGDLFNDNEEASKATSVASPENDGANAPSQVEQDDFYELDFGPDDPSQQAEESESAQENNESDDSVETDAIRQMTEQQRNACINAVSETIATQKLTPEALNWGLDYMKKLYDAELDELQATLDRTDWDAVRKRFEAEEKEEALKEQEEKNQFLKT